MLNYGDASFPLGDSVTVKRLALNMDQITKYKPPENPAKMTDSRFGGYVVKYGKKSWELDALEPKVLADLITRNIKEHIDDAAWKERKEELAAEQATLDKIIEGL
jgi:hypothetical protein